MGGRLLARLVAVCLATCVLIASEPDLAEVVEGEVQAVRINSPAMEALLALSEGDLETLNAHLATHRADPEFAAFFARYTTPRTLGDLVAAESAGDVDQTAYDQVLDDLAGVLSLATRGGGDLELPPAWNTDFAHAVTRPGKLYADAEGDRRLQDEANKQNLLLLLSRGFWSTEFLVETTSAIWELERDAEVDEPWPGVSDEGAQYAAAPGGAYLTDGLVALLAALTANPEAAGWAFTDLDPRMEVLDYGDYPHPIGAFAHHVFLEHRFVTGSDGERSIGASSAATALTSAIHATGGSHDDQVQGPQADYYVLQGLVEEVERLEAEEEAEANKPWYARLGATVVDTATWVKDRAHGVLDLVGLVPVLGAPADVASAAWYAVEGDWEDAGLSAAGTVPFLGDAAQALRQGRRVVSAADAVKDALKQADRVKRLKVSAEAVKHTYTLTGKATKVDDQVIRFYDAEDYLTALDHAEPGLRYLFGETAYEVAADGVSLVHLSGPSRDVVEAYAAQTPDSAVEDDWETVAQQRAALRERTELALDAEQAQHSSPLLTEQVLMRVSGSASGRFYDALVEKPDGTYAGIEVTGSGLPLSLTQVAFDGLVSPTTPAVAVATDGAAVNVTSVDYVNVAVG